jgi:hypothetical protein
MTQSDTMNILPVECRVGEAQPAKFTADCLQGIMVSKWSAWSCGYGWHSVLLVC